MAMEQQPAILVYDQPDMLLLYYRMLRELLGAAYVIVPLSTAADVLDELSRRPVSLVLLEQAWGHPDSMTGLELVQAIKQVAPTPYVIFNPLHDTAELRAAAQLAGVDLYLPKPVPLSTLEAHIEWALAQGIVDPLDIPLPSLDRPERIADMLYRLIKGRYSQAGAPYGESTTGLTRWVGERLEHHGA
jgi:DNA-binding NarL/FixJ family response regulator